MRYKYCVAKMVGTEPVYRTDTVNTWVSDITSSDVKWYASYAVARNAIQTPGTFVVPYENISMDDKRSALLRACESISEALRIGAIVDFPRYCEIHVPKDVFECSVTDEVRVRNGETAVTKHSYISGIPVFCVSEVSE